MYDDTMVNYPACSGHELKQSIPPTKKTYTLI